MTGQMLMPLSRLVLALVYLFGWIYTFRGYPLLGICALVYYLYQYSTTFNKNYPFIGRNIYGAFLNDHLHYGLDFIAWAIFNKEPQTNHNNTADVKSAGNCVQDLKERIESLELGFLPRNRI